MKKIMILLLTNVSCLFSQANLVGKLSSIDTLKIVCEINGCEIHSKETISVYHRSDTLFTDLKTEYDDYIKRVVLSNILSKTSIRACTEFEEKIKKYQNNSRGCTSTATYKISLKNESFELEDKGCKFKDYEVLKIKLFGQDAIENYNKEINH